MKLGYDFEVIRLAFRHTGVALVIAGAIAGIIEGKSVRIAMIAIAIGVVIICCTAIIRRK